MKNILSPVLAFCLVLTHVYGEEVAVLPVVTPQEAAAQEGKQVKVKGVVDGQKTSAKGITYLNFGGRFPNHVFSCVLRSKDFPEGVPSYEGKEVEVTGLIKMYEGKPSMEIKSMDQIHVTSGDTDGAVSTPSASPTGETER
jgi:DNA/RNA endonuclease YhcR with UshA esterase domain